MISINDLTVSFGGFTLLDNINFHINDRDRIGLVGKNGAGKSTMLKLIMGLQVPTSGRIMKPSGLKLGYLPQIMEHAKGRTVMEVTMTAFEELKRMDAAIARRKEEAAAQRKREEQIRVQSTHSRAFRYHFLAELSGSLSTYFIASSVMPQSGISE